MKVEACVFNFSPKKTTKQNEDKVSHEILFTWVGYIMHELNLGWDLYYEFNMDYV